MPDKKGNVEAPSPKEGDALLPNREPVVVNDTSHEDQLIHSPQEGRDPFRRRWLLSLLPRDPEEPRSSTSLELLYDLVFAVAVSQSADGFQDKFLDGNAGMAVWGLFFTFFALWWPWVNYALFASAYDNDDIRFRLYVFVQMVGALFVAQGVKQAYDRDLTVMVIGYVILRVAQLTMWFLVSRHDTLHSVFAMRQFRNLIILQTMWCVGLVVNIVLDRPLWYEFLLIPGVCLEVWGYILAERGAKPHPLHIEYLVDRFGEFSLIVLGETVLSWSVTLGESSFLAHYHPSLSMIVAAAFLGTLSLWWTYFDVSFEVEESKVKIFAIMHYFVFVGITGFGAAIRIAMSAAEGESESPRIACAYVVAVSMVMVILSHWLLRFWILGNAEDWLEFLCAPVSCAVMLLLPLLALVDTNIAFGTTVLLTVLCNVGHVVCFVVRDFQHDKVVCKEIKEKSLPTSPLLNGDSAGEANKVPFKEEGGSQEKTDRKQFTTMEQGTQTE